MVSSECRRSSCSSWHIFHSSSFHHICNIKCRLDCRYSPQNIFNAKNFNPHKRPISLLNVPICTQGMQRTWWPEDGTIIVTGLYYITSFFALGEVKLILATLSSAFYLKEMFIYNERKCLYLFGETTNSNFLDWKWWNSVLNFTEICSQESSWQ